MGKNALLWGGLLLLNIIGFFFYFRLDLTEDKRYSISNPSKNLLRDLQEPVEVTVYLEGDQLPGGFERLRRAVKETLEEFRQYGGRYLSVKFVDPESGSDEEKKARYAEFQQWGMMPTNVFDQKGGRRVEIPVFPYAKVKVGNREEVVMLLKSNLVSSVTAEEKLNQSYENVEYLLATAIHKLSDTDKRNVGFMPDFTSKSPLAFRGMIDALKDRYNFFILDAKASKNFDGLDALIVPAPDKPIDDSTKFKIDQFVMKGGSVLFFVDGLEVDSVGLEGSYAKALDVNLDDLLFNYGIRINKNLVKDGLNAAVIPLVVGQMGDEPNIQPMVYRYFPLVNNFGNSIITKNIGMVLTKYASSVDTVNSGDGLRKTPLLLTSDYTQVLNAPALITFNEARTETEGENYTSGVKALAYLVEGRFPSLYRHRISDPGIIKESAPAKILVVGDGDIIQNETNPKKGTYYPLGFDMYFKHWYGNEDFLLNALNYLIEDDGLLISRNKTVGLRPLDALKIRDERTKIQWMNLGLPLVLLMIFGVVRYYLIRRKYI
ncbi:gliding motility-associated ABC transporter substrate-binding protein GldG [Leadbetterella byssophila]|uniref:gliding motility-associated ABC transporter substrate-binding protein GldG n=1 Tax=Leadbetterella byssophila TaxID=316068 RepID=UPI0039A25BC1